MKAIYKKSFALHVVHAGLCIYFLYSSGMWNLLSFYNISYAYPEIGPTMSSAAIVLLIAAPILSMQTLAEEKKKKTDQLL